MSGAALGLVVAAAFAHASWNLFAKQAGSATLTFVWLYTTLGTIAYAPIALWELNRTGLPPGPGTAVFFGGTIVLHTGYFLLLQHGYRVGDLSFVYPIARGVGPVLAIVGGIALLGEQPTVLAVTGGVITAAGVASIGLLGWWRTADPGSDRGGRRPTAALVYAVLTGGVIACYSVWDAHAVGRLGIAPLVFSWGSLAGRSLLLLPLVWWRKAKLREVWREHRSGIVAVGTLSPLAYILVLVAFTLAPVSYVAPARELSIVIGTVFGTRLLGEGQGMARLAGAATVVAGVVLLSIG